MTALPTERLDEVQEEASFRKTKRQRQLLALANKHKFTLAYGGSRSGKTVAFVRNVFLRAVKRPSHHLIVRFRYNHARTSLGHQTIPYVLRACFPKLPIVPNKAEGYWTVPTVCGNDSTVWLGGTDDQERMEKLLGFEYSTIYLNESSQIPFDAVPLLQTRLAETSGLALRMYFDCNPPGKRHWTYRVFFEKMFPDETEHDWDVAKIRVNPRHNVENLPADYIEMLKRLPKRQRERFLDGLYLTDVEGALWTDIMINRALAREAAELRRTVIAVDPSVSSNRGSDECGIIPCSLDVNGEGVVHDDLSGRLSTRKWAQRVVNAYHFYNANCVVAEVNQGGDLVEDAVHNVDPTVKVRKVRAAVGKLARAEPISELYEEGMERVTHEKRMPKLEAELTETVFQDIKASPNRLDALVWGLTDLMLGRGRVRVRIR